MFHKYITGTNDFSLYSAYLMLHELKLTIGKKIKNNNVGHINNMATCTDIVKKSKKSCNSVFMIVKNVKCRVILYS